MSKKKKIDTDDAEWERKQKQEAVERAKMFSEKPLEKASGYKLESIDEIVGGKVVNIGFHQGVERSLGGGNIKKDRLAIDYEKGGKAMRIVFDCDRWPMWVEWMGERKT